VLADAGEIAWIVQNGSSGELRTDIPSSEEIPILCRLVFGKITFGYVQRSPEGTFRPVGMAAGWRVTGSPEE
jgi:hypothetical protein